VNTKVVEYEYDAFNRLIHKELDADGDGSGTATDIFWVYDGDQAVLQFDGDTAADVSHRYLWGPAVDQLLADETVDDGGEEDVLWAFTDWQGSVRHLASYNAATDTTTIENEKFFDAYGNVTSESNSAVDTLFAYTGRMFDDDTGLQNNLNRWYDPTVGRWLSEDPIGFEAGDPNQYRYVGNSPGDSIDPSGLEAGPIQKARDAFTDYMNEPIPHPIPRSMRGGMLPSGLFPPPANPGDPEFQTTRWEVFVEFNKLQFEAGLMIFEMAFPFGKAITARRAVSTGGRALRGGTSVARTVPAGTCARGWNAMDEVAEAASRTKAGREAAEGACGGAIAAPNGGLVHMTEAGDAIRSSQRLGLPSDLYAGPASNASRSGWELTRRTGLSPSGNFEPITIPSAAESAFSRPLPIGPFTLWQRATGQQYAARGIINLETGAFARTGMNRTQAQWYVIDAGISGTGLATGNLYLSATTEEQ
jgi:RHS repeat-associated protein